MANPFVINMTSDGEGSTEVNLGDILVTMATRFNYSISIWTLDIADAKGEMILSGLMLVPNVDLLSPYPAQKEILGGLVLFEKTPGDYTHSDQLGELTKLIWFPPGTEVVLSI